MVRTPAMIMFLSSVPGVQGACSFVSRSSTVAALILYLLLKMFWSLLKAIRLFLATAVSLMLLGMFLRTWL